MSRITLKAVVGALCLLSVVLSQASYTAEERSPVLSVKPKNVTVAVGGTVQFKCAASGIPGPQLVFLREDDPYEMPKFKNKHAVPGSKNQVYVVYSVTEVNEGWYRCIAANAFGMIETRFYLRVLDLCKGHKCEPPKICVQDIEREVAECVCPTVTCAFKADPVCGADCKVHYNPCLWNQTSCENDYKTTDIISRGHECPEIIPPSVTILHGRVSIEEGEKFKLKCAVAGFPEPTVEWLKVDSAGKVVGIVGEGLILKVKAASLSNTGSYVARATNCITTSVDSSSVFVEVRPTPVPTEPSDERSVCNIFGDPHIHTLDGLTFNFAGECTYILAMDCNGYQWIIYGRFVSCGAGTCLESVTIYVNYVPIQLQRGWILNMNGRKKRFVEGKAFLVNNIFFTFDGLSLKGVIQGAGVSIVWDGFTALQIAVDDDRRITTCGVCGNNDDIIDNEYVQSLNVYKTAQINQPNIFGNSWKVDRLGFCSLPANVRFDPNEPCGVDYAKSYKAKSTCQGFTKNPILQKCKNKLAIEFFYDSCLYDYCYMELLRGKGGVNVECSVARAYANHCSLLGVSTRGWDSYMKCPKEATQDALMTISCPQENVPFLRN